MSYTVTARRWDRGWELAIADRDGKEVGVTQSRGLADAERMVREWLEVTDHPGGGQAHLDWEWDLGDPSAQAELAEARAAVLDAQRAQEVAAQRSRKAIAALFATGLKGSDVARITGLSKQRVSQLAH